MLMGTLNPTHSLTRSLIIIIIISSSIFNVAQITLAIARSTENVRK